MSSHDSKVCGTGSWGVIVNKALAPPSTGFKMIINKHIPIAPASMVYKITTDRCVHTREFTEASFLTVLDPHQTYFVYPVATYSVKRDLTYLAKLDAMNRVPGKKFLRQTQTGEDARTYVDIMPYGGRSLYALDEDDTELTPHQAMTAIKNLVQGMVIIHTQGKMHGDNHEHNVLLDIRPDGKILARWIDFSEMKVTDDAMKLQGDVKRLIRVMRMIAGMVHGRNEPLDSMIHELGKQSPHMTAMELQSYMTRYLAKHRRESSSRRSSSASSSHKHVAKKLAYDDTA